MENEIEISNDDEIDNEAPQDEQDEQDESATTTEDVMYTSAIEISSEDQEDQNEIIDLPIVPEIKLEIDEIEVESVEVNELTEPEEFSVTENFI